MYSTLTRNWPSRKLSQSTERTQDAKSCYSALFHHVGSQVVQRYRPYFVTYSRSHQHRKHLFDQIHTSFCTSDLSSDDWSYQRRDTLRSFDASRFQQTVQLSARLFRLTVGKWVALKFKSRLSRTISPTHWSHAYEIVLAMVVAQKTVLLLFIGASGKRTESTSIWFFDSGFTRDFATTSAPFETIAGTLQATFCECQTAYIVPGTWVVGLARKTTYRADIFETSGAVLPTDWSSTCVIGLAYRIAQGATAFPRLFARSGNISSASSIRVSPTHVHTCVIRNDIDFTCNQRNAEEDNQGVGQHFSGLSFGRKLKFLKRSSLYGAKWKGALLRDRKRTLIMFLPS